MLRVVLREQVAERLEFRRLLVALLAKLSCRVLGG